MGNRPLEVLGRASGEAVSGFQQLRKAVMNDGPLDELTAEYVLVGALASTADWDSLRTHVRRALKLGASAEQLQHAVFVTMGASATLNNVVSGLRVIEEEVAPGDSQQ
ncbi:MAG: carboxymuconolactone decarboxylase family protein [Halieaceae bacterium]|nr:carboxymuconolactone decarboxylase family protein [Halieaceae bacterium]